MAPKAVASAVVDEDPQIYENRNVHAVYDEIASHFSSTRYKPHSHGRLSAAFMSSIATGWVGLDAGTGNGKYLPLPSINLLRIARNAGESGVTREVVWGDVLDHLWRSGVFDYAISIATIHHLATHERRIDAVKRLLECVSPQHGRILIYVWAIEQDELSKRQIPSADEDSNRRGKDVVVPWVLSKPAAPTGKGAGEAAEEKQVFNRYYHMFAKGELSELVHDAAKALDIRIGKQSILQSDQPAPRRGLEIVQDGWERSNYYVELRCWEIHE
ncbi:hypothetical protein FPV67DRAFT_1563885 [Lyophyllum atratum]|nr:hypothetical protein FPV67DRAFT_1563885 [Lyophyllum atratum]